MTGPALLHPARKFVVSSIAGIRALAPDVLDAAEQIHEQLHRAG